MADADGTAEAADQDREKDNKAKLEELFDDADSDEEYSSSMPQGKSQESSQPAPMSVPFHLAKHPQSVNPDNVPEQ
jgi:DNA primase small subunit